MSDRRAFLRTTFGAGAALTLGSVLTGLNGCARTSIVRPNLGLVRDPNGVCDLPAGFSYTVISPYGTTMTDGHAVPDYHDGMGCFAGPDGATILVRNHEISLYSPTSLPSPAPALAYDPTSSGGTTTVWLDDKLNVIKDYLSLTGTIRNCSGGVTPWGTWISCEEAANDGWTMGKRHGYNFEVDPRQSLRVTQPLTAMGRFNHEAVAIDGDSGIAYQTEDSGSGCFYRFLPATPGALARGGELQALRFEDGAISHTTQHSLTPGQRYAVSWVTVDEPDPEKDTVRLQAREKGAAVFVRGEGVVAHRDGIYFACTDGGPAGIGQIFKYTPGADVAGGHVELVFEATERGVLENPDNITVSPWGDLIICEDNDLDQQCLAGLTADGRIYYIASNDRAEWCGACFSPDGQTLFANIQNDPGMTVAIRGPWRALRGQLSR